MTEQDELTVQADRAPGAENASSSGAILHQLLPALNGKMQYLPEALKKISSLMPETQDNYAYIYDVFNRHCLRSSEQRIIIYDYLLKNRIHPGAEAIYRHLHVLHPSLSLTTVYNTLKAFHSHGLVTMVNIEGGEVRYDVNTDFHAHFKCSKCGGLFDMPVMDEGKFRSGLPAGFKVQATHIDFYGICPECSKSGDGK